MSEARSQKSAIRKQKPPAYVIQRLLMGTPVRYSTPAGGWTNHLEKAERFESRKAAQEALDESGWGRGDKIIRV